ncbi:hypothetical protein B0H14DRAFT_1157258 [Mycena olivaceomarginata]|nr:hypothetical protein B0H14DRAFT_1157258 [Mycena olivaceomarginata]
MAIGNTMSNGMATGLTKTRCHRLLGSFWKEAKRDNQDYVEGTVVAASKSWIEKEQRWFARQKANAGRRPRRNAATSSFDGSESDEAQSHHHTAAPKVAYRPSASTPAEQSEQATINSSTSSAEQQKWALLRSRNPALSFSPLPSAEELNLELEREPEQQVRVSIVHAILRWS